MTHTTSAAEESSVVEEDVQPTNFSYNTNQYFFEGFHTDTGPALPGDEFALTVYYTDPVTGEVKEERVVKTVSDALGKQDGNIADAESIHLLTQLISGAMECEVVQQVLDTYDGEYSSPLFDEYVGLIERYVVLGE